MALANVAQALTGGPVELLRNASRAFRSCDATRTSTLTTALAGFLEKPIHDVGACERLLDVAQGLGYLVAEEPSMVGRVVLAIRSRVDGIDADRVPRVPAGRKKLIEALELLARTAPSDRDGFRDAHQRVLGLVLRSIVEKADKTHRDEYTALRAGLTDAALLVVLDAQHAESSGDWRAAAVQWEQAGRMDDALRCARSSADFVESVRLADLATSSDAAMLAWGRAGRWFRRPSAT